MPSYYKKHLDETLRNQIYGGQVPTLDFLIEVSTTRDDEWYPGDTLVLPDGREFRYAKSTGAGIMYPNMGCNFTDTGLISYTATTSSHAAGVVEIEVPAATHAALSKDDLRGGYVVVFDGSGENDMTYGITGNDAADANAAFDIQIDMPLQEAITAGTQAIEVYKNPWTIIAQANTSTLPRCGVPVTQVSAAENYFWLQTKGVKFVNPQSGVGADNGGIEVYWRHDGSLQKGETALAVTTATYDTNQCAGHVVSGSAAGNGPLVNLIGY